MKNLVVLSVFISLVVFLMSLSVYFYYLTPIEEFSFATTAFVSKDTAGFDINSTAITFGSLVVGGSSSRSVLINNSYPFAIRVEPSVEGSIKDIITYEALTVKPYETDRIYLTVSANSYDLIGNYTGNITMRLMRAN